MAIPYFLDTYYDYDFIGGVTDVNTIITALNTQLVTTPPAASKWTDTGGTGVGPFRSPADTNGNYFTITLARVSATHLHFSMVDRYGLPVGANVPIDIDGGGTDVNIYSGPYHLAVSSELATPVAVWCGVLEQSPDPQGFPRPQWFMSVETNYYADRFYFKEIGASVYALQTVGQTCLRCPDGSYEQYAVNGELKINPVEVIWGNYVYGRFYQAIYVDRGLDFADEVTVPIDTGVTGVFKIIGAKATGTPGVKLAYRIS